MIAGPLVQYLGFGGGKDARGVSGSFISGESPRFYFFGAGRTSRTRGERFPVHCGCGDCPVLGVLNPLLKNEDLSVAFSVNFLLGTVIAGVWSSWKAMAGPGGCACALIGWIYQWLGIFPVPPCLGMKEGTRVKYLNTKDLLELDLRCPGRWPLAPWGAWAFGMWLDRTEMCSWWKKDTPDF